ncbi:MAG: hypothetical protein ROO76_23385 [Terriglobia bacterium]|jgi:hypothetical protein|nr:hypothetical protein [Terriglobia bacterium]
MHPHLPRGALRYLLMGLLIAALIVLFPVVVQSQRESAEAAFALL